MNFRAGTVFAAMALSVCLSHRDVQSGTGGGGRNVQGVNKTGRAPQSSRVRPAQPLEVSIVRLIANPQAHHGKAVRVVGFARITFEGNAVYLHQDDYRHFITKNALWLAVPKKEQRKYMEYDQKYVLIEGTFDADDTGHLGSYSGAIKNIDRVQVQVE